MKNLLRRLTAAGAVVLASSSGTAPRAQSVAPVDRKITYILPQMLGFPGASPQEIVAQASILRARIGEGPRVKVGFTTYIVLTMMPVDPAEPLAVRAALAPQIAEMDTAIALARAANIPICISIVTPERDPVDAAEIAAQAEDRRVIQWHSDNSIATGWSTLSRYARRDAA